ncbi:MAG: class I SAM-dependent methyltransferase [Candidatus Micrarchaeota archaeon]
MKVEEAFDAIAGEWEEYRSKSRVFIHLFFEFLPKNSARKFVVLDAGCGNGNNIPEIARRARRVIAIDVSRKMLAFARKRVRALGLSKKVRIAKADFAKRLPLPDASVDAAFFVSSFHHLRKREQASAFRELNRVLKRGGIAFISFWNKRQKRFQDENAKSFLVQWKLKTGESIGRFHYLAEPSELRALAKRYGFAVVDLFFEKNGKRISRRKDAHNVCLVLKKN